VKSLNRPLVFDCAGEQLLGVLTSPAAGVGTSGLGVVILVGGPQYRVGAHRQFVQLAKRLAADGHTVLRFDVRGMGDSTGEQRSFEALDDDLRAAIDALHREVPGLKSLVLWGLCDGASAALTYWAGGQDPRIKGMCLVNPWLRSAETLAKTHVKHYYRQRLMQPDFWLKLLRGGVATKAVRDLWQNLRLTAGGGQRPTAASVADFRTRMAMGWLNFKGPLLLITSNDDYTAREFVDGCSSQPVWRGALSKALLQRRELAGADHTFSSALHRQAMEDALSEWLFFSGLVDRPSNGSD